RTHNHFESSDIPIRHFSRFHVNRRDCAIRYTSRLRHPLRFATSPSVTLRDFAIRYTSRLRHPLHSSP
ncbi:unnamed protein product, partial [Closterium sp. Naga37s-1]